MPAEVGATPHVVIVVPDQSAEDRALRTAVTLARAGARATVVVRAVDAPRSDLARGDVRVLRVPLATRLADGRTAGRRRRRAHRFVLVGWRSAEEEAAARARPAVLLRESPGSGWARRRAGAARFQVRARGALQRRIDAAVTRAWRAWDRGWDRIGPGARWRRVVPEARDFDVALGPTLAALRPDVLHAVGPLALPTVALSADRIGVPIWLYDASGAPSAAPRRAAALARIEREHAPGAAAVVVGDDARRAETAARSRRDATTVAVVAGGSDGTDPVAADRAWQAQEPTLLAAFRAAGLDLREPAGVFEVPAATARAADRSPVLAIGPANSAGQAWAWGRAAERFTPGVRAEVVGMERDNLPYPADVLVTQHAFVTDLAWQLDFTEHALSTWTHVLLESGRSLLGVLNGRDFVGDARVLGESGLRVGLVFHGSDVRDPRRHAATHRWSPFTDPGEDLTHRLQRRCDLLLPQVDAFDGPRFVSTPDLFDYVRDAIWLPVVVDTEEWRPQPTLLEREVPLVVHAPSSTILKGTADVEAALLPLAEQGLIDYRRIEGVPPAQVRGLLESADVIVDQVRLGLYGVLACEGLALGRVVVGHVGDSLRSRVPAEVPVVEATPDTLAEVVTGLVRDRDAARAHAATGPEFVRRFHDGRLSAEVLQQHLLG